MVTTSDLHLARYFEAQKPPAELVGLSEAELVERLREAKREVDDAREWTGECNRALFATMRQVQQGRPTLGYEADLSLQDKASHQVRQQLRLVKQALAAAETREVEARRKRQALAQQLKRVRHAAILWSNAVRHEREHAERAAREAAAAEAVVRGVQPVARSGGLLRLGRQLVRMPS